MALPKITKLVYPIYFKSIDKHTTFRPFTVAEEKILMHIRGSKNINFIKSNLINLISNCVSDDVNVSALAMYDVEYFLTQVRSRSVGEIIELQYTDPENNAKIKATINLEDVSIVEPEGHESKIEITEEIGLLMKDPDFSVMLQAQVGDDPVAQTEMVFNVILNCIDSIYDAENVYKIGVDTTREELEEFVDQLPTTVSSKLMKYFETLPHVQAIAKLADGREVPIQGIQNFLAF